MTSPNPSPVPTNLVADQPLEVNYEVLLIATRDLAADQPVLMPNLLRYREQADYGPQSTKAPRSGREAYQEYIQAFLAYNSPQEAKVFFQGPALAAFSARRIPQPSGIPPLGRKPNLCRGSCPYSASHLSRLAPADDPSASWVKKIQPRHSP